jgi:hypothetical protein
MEQTIPVTNKTMELTDCKNDWFFDEKNKCWCLEDILYTPKPTTPKFQRLSIFVPEPYMKEGGVINPEGTMNGYTATTVPVIFENNSAGYMQMPHVWLGGPRCFAEQYLEKGFVYVTCGNRGHESKDADGTRVGKAPTNLIDLKMGIRFIRHNAAALPGDMNKIISVGWSAGGAMSSLLATTGNNANYNELLAANGAFMDESDAVYAAQIYCPIIDLEHADLAYEWCFAADKENEDSPEGPGGVMDAFREALSKKLGEKYIAYFNGLGLKKPETGEALVFGADGRSGSAYDYLMEKLNGSATKFLTKLEKGELEQTYSVEDYLSGNYTYMVAGPNPHPGDQKKEEKEMDLMRGHAGPGVALRAVEHAPSEPMTLGDMLSRPPKGVEPKPHVPPMMEVAGKDKSAWLSWDGTAATLKDLDSYVLNHRRRMKPCTSFDVLAKNSGENKVYGSAEDATVHFNVEISEALEELKEQFPKEYETYYEAYRTAVGNEALDRQKYLINPLNFIGSEEKSDAAEHYRIRVGASDADTSFSVSMTLACKLAQAGKDVDYALVWDQPHSEADYPGEVIDWIERITK